MNSEIVFLIWFLRRYSNKVKWTLCSFMHRIRYYFIQVRIKVNEKWKSSYPLASKYFYGECLFPRFSMNKKQLSHRGNRFAKYKSDNRMKKNYNSNILKFCWYNCNFKKITVYVIKNIAVIDISKTSLL